MTKKVITLKRTDTLKKTLQMFKKHKISGFPVIDSKRRLVGIVSETDILKIIDIHSKVFKTESSIMLPLVMGIIRSGKHFEQIQKHIKDIMNVPVKKFMKKNIVTLDIKDDIYKASSVMTKKDINRIPIVKNKKLVGIITRSDIVNVLIGKRLINATKK